MLVLARVITIGAYNRNESRGAHYKPEFPERNDEEWLKTTMASFQGAFEKPQFTYDDVDVSLIHLVNVITQVSLKGVKNND